VGSFSHSFPSLFDELFLGGGCGRRVKCTYLFPFFLFFPEAFVLKTTDFGSSLSFPFPFFFFFLLEKEDNGIFSSSLVPAERVLERTMLSPPPSFSPHY